MNLLESFVPDIHRQLGTLAADLSPWQLIDELPVLLERLVSSLGDGYVRKGSVVVHRTAEVHSTAILRDLVIVGPKASIGPHVMLRGGVWVGEGAHIGGSDEIKQSIIGPRSAAAHLNYVGNSIVGSDVNIEAGAVLANHFNERDDKTIWVLVDGEKIRTGVKKFGAMVGDGSRIGANAVTTPGTVLAPNSVVGRLELVRQIP
jgi:bifunctional N-acetylglucosamine-1-phosphate-uridyltransferase/glucosamine-1-phosphate-acetyltransferase GlmU-like protein